MPDYDLGKAHGEVEIDYDSDGVAKAKDDLDSLGDSADESSKRVKESSKVTQQEYDQMAKAADKLASEVDKLASADIAAKAKQKAAVENYAKVMLDSEHTAKDAANAEKLVQSAQKESEGTASKLAIATESLRSVREQLNNQTVHVDVDVDQAQLEQVASHVKNIDKSTKDGLSGLNSYAGRLSLVAKAAAVSAPALANVVVSLAQLSGLAGIAAGGIAAAGVSLLTVKTGLAGVSDAFKEIGKDGKVSDETMQKLAPSAQAFVKELEKIKPAWEGVQKSVQNALFQNLAKSVGDLAGIYIPLLQGKMTTLAGAFNQGAVNVLAFFRASQTVTDVGTIFDNTTAAVSNLSTAGNNILGIFRDIAVVGSSFLPGIATSFTTATQAVQDFVVNARETGKLQQWMQGALDVLSQLWQLLVNLGSIIFSVFGAFSQAGGGAFNTLVSLTGQLAAFLKTAEGQQFLLALGQALNAIGTTYGRVFMALLQALVPVITALAPLVQQFATTVGDDLVIAIKAAAPILDLIAKVLQVLGPFIIPVVAAMYSLNKVITVATAVWKVFSAVLATNPFVLIAAAVIAIVILIVTHWNQIASFLSGVWNGIKSVATSVWNGIKDFFSNLIDAVVGFFKKWGTTILAIIAPFIGIPLLIYQNWGKISSFFGGIIDSIVNFFKALPGKVGSFLASLPGIVGNALLTALKWGLNVVIQGLEWIIAEIIAFPLQVAWVLQQLGIIIANAFTAAFQWALQVVIAGATAVWNFISTIPGVIWNFLSSLPGLIGQLFTDAWNWALNTSIAIVTAVWNFISSIPGVVWGFLSNLPSMLGNLFTDAWNWVLNTTTSIVSAVWGFVSSIPGRIWGFLSGLPSQLGNLARDAWNWFVNSTISAANAVWGFISSIPGRILGALGDLGGLLLNAGRAIVNGLLNGIKSAIGGVFDFVSGIASKVASLKGPLSYDRRLLIPHGNAIMDGLKEGLVNGFNPVLVTVSEMAGQIGDTFASTVNDATQNLSDVKTTITATVTPAVQAAQEMLKQLQTDGQFFEDFSFFGNSANVAANNGTIADAFYAKMGPGYDFSGSQQNATDIENFLKEYIASGGGQQVTIQNLNVAGNLDPTNKPAWREAMKNIDTSLKDLARQY